MMDFSSLFEPEAKEQVELKKPRRRFRPWPVLLSVILLPLLVLVGWFGFLFLRPRLEPLLGLVLRRPAAQESTPASTETTAALLSTGTAVPSLTPTQPQPTPSATLAAAIPECAEWSQVTLDQLDQKMCVFGEYVRQYQRDDGTYVMVFSEDPGTFQVWSYPKAFEWYLKGVDSTCVMARGWIQTSGVRPIIILGSKGTLEPCP
jgi:hypothetical protein